MYQIPLGNLNDAAQLNPIIRLQHSNSVKFASHKILSDTGMSLNFGA